MKSLLGLLLTLSGILVYGQEMIFDKSFALTRGLKDKRDAYPVLNDSTGSVVMFLFDNSSIQATFLDKEYNIKYELNSPRAQPAGTFSEILGSSIWKGIYTIYFSSSKHKEFAAVNFDFENNKVTQMLIKIPFKKGERYAGSLSHNGTFYIITALEPDIVRFYSLTDPRQVKFRETSFPKEKFSSKPGTNLYEVLTENNIVTIDNNVPTPLDVAAKLTKLYAYGNKIVLTIDNYEFRTAIVEVDATTLQSTLKSINQPSVYCGDYDYSSWNSYIFNHNLYQIKVCPLEMDINIVDFEKIKVLNKLTIKEDDEDFSISNSTVIQKGGFYDNEVTVSKPKKFLRKVASRNSGISAVGTPDGIQLTIGAYEEFQRGAPAGGPIMPGSTISTPFGTSVSPPVYNPGYYSYRTGKVSVSVYFKSLLEPSTYQHKVGEIKDSPFEKIEKFTEGIEKKIAAETIFKKDGVYILGYYFKPDDKYILRMFTE
jgi:hypothetical protein